MIEVPIHMRDQFPLERPNAIRPDRYIDMALDIAADRILDAIADRQIEEPDRFDEFSMNQ